MPVIASKEVRFLRGAVLVLLDNLVKNQMELKDFEYLKAEVEHAFARTLRMEAFDDCR